MKSILLLIFLSGCSMPVSSGDVIEFDLSTIPVESTAVVDVTDFNLASEAALAGGDRWPTDLLMLVNEFIYHGASDREVSSLELKVVPQSVENPRRVSVYIIRDGFLDDAVRGDWIRLDLKLRDDGRWLVNECRRAFRNRRGEITDRYVSD